MLHLKHQLLVSNKLHIAEVELEKPEPLVVGQPMKNINYFTNKKDPIVMADEEYPSWIFDVIGDKPKRTEILKDSEIQSAKELKRNNKLKIREWQLENTKKK